MDLGLLLELEGAWTLLIGMVFGMIAVFREPDIPSMTRRLAAGGAWAPFIAGFFAIPSYLLIHT